MLCCGSRTPFLLFRAFRTYLHFLLFSFLLFAQVWEAKLAQSDTAAQPAAPAAETDVNQHLAYFYSNNAYNLDSASMPPESALLLNPSYAQHMARAAAGYSHPQPQEPPVEPQYGRPQPYMVLLALHVFPTYIPVNPICNSLVSVCCGLYGNSRRRSGARTRSRPTRPQGSRHPLPQLRRHEGVPHPSTPATFPSTMAATTTMTTMATTTWGYTHIRPAVSSFQF